MATRLLGGPKKFSLVRDKDRFRDYKLTLQVLSDNILDGPEVASNTPGLPLPGSAWVVGNDLDIWVWCRWGPTSVTADPEKLPTRIFNIEYTFSNRPDDYCQNIARDNPLLEPPVIGGSFVRRREEAAADVFGNPILNSAWEQVRGSQIEFDADSPTVKIAMNVAILNLPLLALATGKVNAFPLWGLPSRTIKLAPPSWERKFYKTCQVYYTWHLEFEIKYETWDKLLPDEGTKCLNGTWQVTSPTDTSKRWVLTKTNGNLPNPLNPNDFSLFKDPTSGNPCRVMLNGSGLPAGVIVNKGTIVAPSTQVSGLSINRAGSGYAENDILTVSGGTGTAAQMKVISVASGIGSIPDGAIQDMEMATDATNPGKVLGGSYTVKPPDPNDLTGGAGTGANVNLFFQQIPGSGAFYSGAPGKIFVEKYAEFDFSLLGVPIQF